MNAVLYLRNTPTHHSQILTDLAPQRIRNDTETPNEMHRVGHGITAAIVTLALLQPKAPVTVRCSLSCGIACNRLALDDCESLFHLEESRFEVAIGNGGQSYRDYKCEDEVDGTTQYDS
jgi:hypothetical protein